MFQDNHYYNLFNGVSSMTKKKSASFALTVILIFSLVLLFAGCGGSGSEEERGGVVFDDDDVVAPDDDDSSDDDDAPDDDTTDDDDDDSEEPIPGGWIIEGNTAGFTDLALTSSDLPVISYKHKTQGLKYGRWDGSSWSTDSIDNTPGAGWGTSIALYNDLPAIAFHRKTNQTDGDLFYAWWSVKGWSVETVDTGVGHEQGAQLSLAFKSDGTPCIAYHHINNMALNVACKSGSWSTMEIDASGTDSGLFPSLAFNSADHGFVSFYTYTEVDKSRTGELKLASDIGAGWTTEVVDDGGGGDVGQWTALAIDPTDDSIHIAYQDMDLFDLKYSKFHGGWQTETVDGMGTKGADAEIAVISGYVWIIYQDGSVNSIRQALWNGTYWHKITVMDGTYFQGEFGFWIGMELDSDSEAVFSHYDPLSEQLLIYPQFVD